MNQIETAQYIVKEFMRIDKTAINVREGDHPLEAIIVFDDGSERSCNGKLAYDLLSAKTNRDIKQ